MNLRFFIALAIIIFITPQTSKIYYNYVVETIYSTGLLLNYKDVKDFVFKCTWFFICLFILLNILTVF